jgi:chemotaxis protein methyltransferase CheR
LGLAWHGFRLRRIRRRVYGRIEERIRQLALPDIGAYRTYLEGDPGEWAVLDSLCWIPISRFYRDKAVFQFLERPVLHALASKAIERGETELRCWSAGCAAGEEPYTVAMIWQLRVAAGFPTLRLRVVATDIDPAMISRARAGCYPAYSVKDVPADIAARGFLTSPGGSCVRDEFRRDVELVEQDIRRVMPDGGFHLILCRNLVLTYFEETLQRDLVERVIERLLPSGVVIFGHTESIPAGVRGLEPWSVRLRIYRRREGIAAPGEAANPQHQANAEPAPVDFSIG